MRPLENLSRLQRRLTPLPLCRWLVEQVLRLHATSRAAVLWIEPRATHYWKLFPQVELWGPTRDARTYPGPWPVICHPPCGPWGKYHSKSHESQEHGIKAMELVHRWGGVVEHPVGSSLFRDHGKNGRLEKINQSDFGHQSIKQTLLYWIDKETS